MVIYRSGETSILHALHLFHGMQAAQGQQDETGRLRNVGNLHDFGSGLDDDPTGRVRPRLAEVVGACQPAGQRVQ